MTAAGVEIGRGHITVTANAKNAVAQVGRQFGTAMPSVGKDASKKFGASFASSLKGVLGAAAILGTVTKAFSFGKEALAEARESQKVGALTTQVIKTTGGAAKITADQVGNLATAISKKTGIDDEQIQSGANMLLTFTNIRNEVGKGNDIFNQATGIVTDMSAALGQDTKSSAIQLGKALNNPIKGVTALQRVGVAFTDDQKKQITTLVESGRTLDAQKIILRELGTEFGGAAEASATAGDKMNVAFGNLKEQVGTALLPLVDGFANLMTSKVIPALSQGVSWLSEKIPAAIARLRAGSADGGGLGRFAELFRSVVLPALRSVVAFIQAEVVPRVVAIAQAWLKVYTTVAPIIIALVRAVVGKFREMQPQINSVMTSVREIVTGVLDIIRTYFANITKGIKIIWDRWGTQITQVVVFLASTLLRVISGLLKAMAGIIKLALAVMRGDWSGAWKAIQQIFSGVWTAIKAILSAAWTVIKRATSAAMDFVHGKIRDALGKVRGVFDTVVAGIGRKWNELKELARKPIAFVVNTVINAGLIRNFNKIAKLLPGVSTIPEVSFATGGFTGKGGKYDAAGVVHKGEYVLTRDEVRRAGGPGVVQQWAEQFRAGLLSKPGDIGIPGYATGGFVNGLSFARRQVGKPYIFGAVGPGGYDCSGIIAAIQNVIEGKMPYRRRYDTTAFAGQNAHDGWLRGARSPFMIGVDTRAGRFGHMAGTLLGTNVESAGGVGVRMGGSARGANSSYFAGKSHFGYTGKGAGGILSGALSVLMQAFESGFSSLADWFKDLISGPLDKLRDIVGSPLGQMAAALPRKLVSGMTDKLASFDTGDNWLQPGLNLAYNGTGRAEHLVTPDKAGFTQQNIYYGNFGWDPEEIAKANARRGRDMLAGAGGRYR